MGIRTKINKRHEGRLVPTDADLVSLSLQLSDLVLDHSALLLVHFTVQSQLLHLESQTLLLMQELTNTHTNHC